MKSRKFILSVGILVISAVALFTGVLPAGSWVALSTLVLGGYAASNVIEKKAATSK